jgi:glutathione S-transferase
MAYELYWISGSPYAWRAQLALEIKGLDYVSRRLDPADRAHKSPEYLAMNPRGKVPVLRDGDVTVYESLAILAYLESKHAEPPLFGRAAVETAFIWQRVFELENYVRPAIFGMAVPFFAGQAAEKAEEIKTFAADSHTELKPIEDTLSRADYLAGQTVLAADVVFVPILQSLLRALGKDEAAPLDLGFLPLDKTYPRIAAWMSRIEAIPGYDKTYPPHWRD